MSHARGTGFALTRRIRSTPALASLPIVMLTSGVLTEDRNRCLRLGVGVCLPKPVDERDLHAPFCACFARAPEKTATHAPQAAPVPDSGALHVLLAEDNKVNQLIGVKLLEKLGHFVSVAGDGDEVSEFLEQLHADQLVHLIVLGQQDVQRAGVGNGRGLGRVRRRLFRRALAEHAQNGGVQIALIDRFGQADADAQTQATIAVFGQDAGGQHDDRKAGQAGVERMRRVRAKPSSWRM